MGYDKPPKGNPKPVNKKPAAAKLRSGPERKKPGSKGAESGKTGAKAGIIAAICAVTVLCVALLGGGIFINRLDTVYPGVSMDGIDIGGLSAYEAAVVLEDSGFKARGNLTVSVELPTGRTLNISAREAGVAAGSVDAAVAAFKYGREGNLLSNLFVYLECVFKGAKLTVESEFRVDEAYVRGKIEEIVREINLDLTGSDVSIFETYISVVKGSKSLRINADEIYKLVAEAFRDGGYGTTEYVPSVYGNEDEIDIEALYAVVYSEPENAEYDKETDSVSESAAGMSFDVQRAQILWDAAKNGDEIQIPLIFTEPEISADYLRSILFRDLLGGKSTGLTYNYNRNNNVTLAAAGISGCVLMPGEEFSYNGTVGRRTSESGYLPAGAYSNGKEVVEIGGGICQVSSTLYYCTLLANLEITGRVCHYFGVSYLPTGLDATVSWPSPDFKFRNNREFPIRINAYTDLSNYTVTVEIYGTDTDGSYVVMETAPWSGELTYGATSYRCVYAVNGTLIGRTREASSEYHLHIEEEEEPEEPEIPEETDMPEETEDPEATEDSESPELQTEESGDTSEADAPEQAAPAGGTD